MRTLILALSIALLSALFSCSSDDGVTTDGLTSLIRTINEPAGANCSSGGLRVDSGMDLNRNDALDEGEITNTSYICTVDGTAGVNSLLNINTVNRGTTCPNGGIQIDSGLDDNGDNLLGADEIDVTRFVCNGVDGSGGSGGIIQEQIRIPFGSRFLNTSNADDWEFFNDVRDFLVNFNKHNYLGADSVVVAMRLTSSNPNNSQCVAELYNVTDDVPVANTQLISNQVAAEDPPIYYYSSNIYDDLPETEASFVIRARSQVNLTNVSVGWPSYLMIYRQVN